MNWYRGKKMQEVLDFYQTHTAEQTAAQFGLSLTYFLKVAARIAPKYKKTGWWTDPKQRAEVLDFYQTHTAEQTAAKFGLIYDSKFKKKLSQMNQIFKLQNSILK